MCFIYKTNIGTHIICNSTTSIPLHALKSTSPTSGSVTHQVISNMLKYETIQVVVYFVL